MTEEPRDPKRSRPPAEEQSPWAVAGLGMQFFVSLMVFVYAGNWLDRRFDMAPVFLLSGVLLGGGGAFYAGYRRLTAPRTPRDRNSNDLSDSP